MNRLFGDGRDWFFKKRFGMFIHWGLYAIPAWHEQILWRGNMKRVEYETLIDDFNPSNFNPHSWLDILESVGMEYLCITTKHHDGFCLWDTKYTQYNVMNTPYKRDVIGQLSEACHQRGINLGFYYSLPDWHHPNYPGHLFCMTSTLIPPSFSSHSNNLTRSPTRTSSWATTSSSLTTSTSGSGPSSSSSRAR